MLTQENGFKLNINWKFSDTGKYAFTLITLFVILISIYSNSFQGEWHFDDAANIGNNPYIQIKSFSWDEIKKCSYGINQERPDRPLSYLSFAINYYFDGENVFGYHVVNFIIHYLAAVFLFLFIYNTLTLPLLREKYSPLAYPIAMLATFFWAVNPVHVTSITYIVQRMASMAALFYIMSMYFYLKARTQDKFSHSIILFSLCFISGLAAVLSKENAAMLPVSIFLYDLFLIQGLNKENIKRFSKFAALPLVVILIIGFIYIDFTTILQSYNIRDFTMVQRLLTEPRIIIFYLSLLFYPLNSRLTLLYNIDVSRSLLQPWTTIPAILLIVIIIGFAIYIAKKRPLISFCIIFYFLNHIIEGSIFPLELIYEHRNYLPSMLLFIPLAELIIYLINYFSYKRMIQYIVTFGIVIILVGQGDITYRRNAIFSSAFNLWYDNIEKYPNLSRTHSNLGNVFLNDKYQQRVKGLQEYQKAMNLNNFGRSDARAIQEHNLGLYYYQEGKYSQALHYFESSYKSLPRYLSNYVFIARIKLLNNNIQEARRIIEKQIEKYPDKNKLIELLTFILYKEGNFKEAAVLAKKSLKNDISDTFPLVILAEISRYQGNLQSAISFWKLYQQSSPHDSYANLALIELYFNTNKYKLLDEEIAKLYCLKSSQTIPSYIKALSRNKNLLIYIPDLGKIENIIEKRMKYS